MLHTQQFLRDGGTLEELTSKFAITVKRHQEYHSIVLLKYNQIESPFDQEIVRECRGLILDEARSWNVVSAPFWKFFNAGEFYAAKVDWGTARVLEKLDGSLMTLFVYDGKWHVSSSGTPDAGGEVNGYGFTFKELFWRTYKSYFKADVSIDTIMRHCLPPIDCGKCFMFEMMSPYNKIVVRHERPRIAVLGGRDLNTLKELTVEEAHKFFPEIECVKSFPLTTLEECVATFEHMSPLSQEGYVVVDSNFNRVKVKSPAYVALHHMKDALSSRRALVEVARSGEIQEVVANFPEHAAVLCEAKARLDELARKLEAIYDAHCKIESQKEFALAIRHCPCSSALFSLRAKKTTSIKKFLSTMHIDSLMKLLDYKTNEA